MDSDSPEDTLLAGRRKRARLAQRAFRQRQLDLVDRLESEITALKTAIQDIGNFAYSCDHDELDQVVNRALRLANLKPIVRKGERLKTTKTSTNKTRPSSITTFNTPTVRGPSLRDGPLMGHAAPIAKEQILLGQEQQKLFHLTDTSVTIEPNYVPVESIPLQVKQDAWRDAPQEGHQTGRMSPRFSYGLCIGPDLIIHLDHPPPEIMPFLGDGENNFAGTIFWGTVEIGCLILQHSYQQMSSPGFQAPWNATSLQEAIFGMCFKLESPESILKRISVKLTLRKNGSMSRYDYDAAVNLHHLILQDLARRGDSTMNYMSALEVADYVRQRFGSKLLARLDAAAKSKDDRASKRWVVDLVKRLAFQCILFGDGPKFRVRDVEDALTTCLPMEYKA